MSTSAGAFTPVRTTSSDRVSMVSGVLVAVVKLIGTASGDVLTSSRREGSISSKGAEDVFTSGLVFAPR